MRRPLLYWFLLATVLSLLAFGIYLAWQHEDQDAQAQQVARVQNQLQRWASTARRLPCPAKDEDSGLEDCSLLAEKEFYRGALPWKTIGLSRRFGQEIEYRLHQAYTQPMIFNRVNAQALCRSGFYPTQSSISEAAFQLYSTSPTHLIGEARRWHMLPHLGHANLPQVFFTPGNGADLQWFSRCGGYAYPQRKQAMPEGLSFNAHHTFQSLDGTLLVQGNSLWQRQINRWHFVQHLGTHPVHQLVVTPENRSLVQLNAQGELTVWSRQYAREHSETEDSPLFAALPTLPPDWQAIANAGHLRHLSISPNGQWLAAFYTNQLRFWQRVNGNWLLADTSYPGDYTASSRFLRWNEGNQMSAWVIWKDELRRVWLTGAYNGVTPSTTPAPFFLHVDDGHYLLAPDGSNDVLHIRCGSTIEITRFSALGERLLPVAQRSVAKDEGMACEQFGWETMEEILSINQSKQTISHITPPFVGAITHESAQD